MENIRDKEVNPLITKIMFANLDDMIKLLDERKIGYLIRQTTESATIIFSDTKFIFPKRGRFPTNKLFLFKMVKNDVIKWVGSRKRIKLPPKHDTIKFNINYDDSYGSIVAVDLNHAYWRIAHIKGFISENTYQKGLDPKCKAIRLATLSVLGKERTYHRYLGGEIIETKTIREENKDLMSVYKFVRYYCYLMMYDMSKMLGNDFDCWKTDCIYFRKTDENVKKIVEYLGKMGLSFKMTDGIKTIVLEEGQDYGELDFSNF